MTQTRYDFHGVTLAVEVADAELGRLVDARFRHFRTAANGPADLRFDVRFGSSIEAARGGGRIVYESPAGVVRYFDDDDVLVVESERPAAARCEPAHGTTHIVATEAERASRWLLSRPLVTLPLIESLKRRGLFSVHAAGVAVDGRAILLAGPTGAGKSTLALALVRAGYELLGDDMQFLSVGGGLQIHAFPDETDVASASARWFPELPGLAAAPDEGWVKHRVRPEEHYDVAIRMDAAPGLVLFPELAGVVKSTAEPVSPEAATLRLVPNVLLTERQASQAHLDALQALVDASECYALLLGSDLDNVSALIGSLLG